MTVRLPGSGAMAPLTLGCGIVLQLCGVITVQTLDYIAMYTVWWVLWKILGRSGLSEVSAPIAAFGVVLALVCTQIFISDIIYMPYLLVVPANLVAAWLFARSVLSDRRAILLDLIEIIGLRPIDQRFRRFVEGQCLLWCAMCFAMAVVATLAMVWADQRAALAGILSVLVFLQIVWFALSHYYASFRYNRPETWTVTLRTMIRPDVWARMGVQ